MKTYQVYTPAGLVGDTNSAVAALRRVAGTRGAYLVTDGQGPRSEGTERTRRHDTGGVINRRQCAVVRAAIGPLELSDRVYRGLSGSVECVARVDVGAQSKIRGSLWSVTVFDETTRVKRVHCERWTELDQVLVPEGVR